MQLLTFQLAGTPYALPLESVAEVVAAPPIRRVPLGPRGVLGLAEAGGRVVAVLDLPFLLDERTRGGASSHLVRLAAPYERSALAVSGMIRAAAGTPVPGRDSGPAGAGHVLVDGLPHILLDPSALIRRAAEE